MSGTSVYLLVRPKIPDLVAISARRALTDRLGLNAAVLGLDREDLWEITCGPEVGAADLVERILDASTVLANTSKQFVRMRDKELPQPLAGPDGTLPTRVEVEEASEAIAEREVLRNVYGFDEIVGLRQSVVWTLHLDAGLSDGSREEVIERAVVTRSRLTGLLVNPHYQEHRFLDLEPM